MTDRVTAIRAELTPIVESLGLSVYDVTLAGGDRPTLAVLVDRAGARGVDLDELETATRTVSAALDAMDPVHGRYLLEVSSPGSSARCARRSTSPARSARSSRARRAMPRATWPDCAASLAAAGDGRRSPSPRTRATTRSRSTPSTRRAPSSSGDPRPSPGRDHARAGRRRSRPSEQPSGTATVRRPPRMRSGAPMNTDMMEALYTIEREKGISVEIMLEALANALVTAYKRMPDAAEEALVEIDIETGDIHVIAQELDEEGHVVKEWDDTPERLRPHRRADGQAGDPAADPRGRARDEVRGVRRPRGRHRHRDHPADRPALHAARPRQGRGAAAPGRAGPERALRPRQPAQGLHRRGPQDREGPADRRVPDAPGPGEAALRARGPRAARRRRRAARRRPRAGAPHEDRGRVERPRTWTRSARASAHAARGCARSSPSCAARRSTSSPTPTTPPTS